MHDCLEPGPFQDAGLEAAVGHPSPTVTACTVAEAQRAGKGTRTGRGGEVNDPTSDQHTRLCGVPSRYRHRVSTCASPRAETGQGRAL